MAGGVGGVRGRGDGGAWGSSAARATIWLAPPAGTPWEEKAIGTCARRTGRVRRRVVWGFALVGERQKGKLASDWRSWRCDIELLGLSLFEVMMGLAWESPHRGRSRKAWPRRWEFEGAWARGWGLGMV